MTGLALLAALTSWREPWTSTRAGAGTVVFQPTADEPDMVGFARFVAREVRPLVSSSGVD